MLKSYSTGTDPSGRFPERADRPYHRQAHEVMLQQELPRALADRLPGRNTGPAVPVAMATTEPAAAGAGTWLPPGLGGTRPEDLEEAQEGGRGLRCPLKLGAESQPDRLASNHTP